MTAAFLILCAEAGVPWERACRGQLFGDDFPKLTVVAGKVASSPLILCDACQAPSLASSLEALVVRQSLRMAIHDWCLDEVQLGSLRELSRRLGIVAVMPAQ